MLVGLLVGGHRVIRISNNLIFAAVQNEVSSNKYSRGATRFGVKKMHNSVIK
jgi:hypothetical protein